MIKPVNESHQKQAQVLQLYIKNAEQPISFYDCFKIIEKINEMMDWGTIIAQMEPKDIIEFLKNPEEFRNKREAEAIAKRSVS